LEEALVLDLIFVGWVQEKEQRLDLLVAQQQIAPLPQDSLKIFRRKETHTLRVEVVEVLRQVLISAFELSEDASDGEGHAFEEIWGKHFLLNSLHFLWTQHSEVELHLLLRDKSSKLRRDRDARPGPERKHFSMPAITCAAKTGASLKRSLVCCMKSEKEATLCCF